jgi:hypothetical protein
MLRAHAAEYEKAGRPRESDRSRIDNATADHRQDGLGEADTRPGVVDGERHLRGVPAERPTCTQLPYSWMS